MTREAEDAGRRALRPDATPRSRPTRRRRRAGSPATTPRLPPALAERRRAARERVAAVGDGAVIRPPFHCDYGYNISLGAGAFLNFNCVILDVSRGRHRREDPDRAGRSADRRRPSARGRARDAGLEFGRPIRIGRNVWIGAAAIVLPGVTRRRRRDHRRRQHRHPRRAGRGHRCRQPGSDPAPRRGELKDCLPCGGGGRRRKEAGRA